MLHFTRRKKPTPLRERIACREFTDANDAIHAIIEAKLKLSHISAPKTNTIIFCFEDIDEFDKAGPSISIGYFTREEQQQIDFSCGVWCHKGYTMPQLKEAPPTCRDADLSDYPPTMAAFIQSMIDNAKKLGADVELIDLDKLCDDKRRTDAPPHCSTDGRGSQSPKKCDCGGLIDMVVKSNGQLATACLACGKEHSTNA